MGEKDWRNLERFLRQYGRDMVQALKSRAPVDTGSLRADIKYSVDYLNGKWVLSIYIDDHIKPRDSILEPSQYGNILDKSSEYHYRSGVYRGLNTKKWWSAEFPGLSREYYIRNVKSAIEKDVAAYEVEELRKIFGNTKVKKKS